jgi:Cof subfamily protein (haloacid dehalogenase superfamily)
VTPRLVALDVDGTLLRSDDALAPRVRDALGRAAGAGWHLVLVTGRPLAVALPVVHDLGLGEYLVAANGATVATVAEGTVLHQASLPGTVVVAAIERAKAAVPGLGLAVTTPRGFVREPGFAAIAPLSRSDGAEVADATPRPEDLVHSAVLFIDGMDALDLQRRLASVLPREVAVTPSGLPGSVELTAPGVHKGSGLAWLCAHIGVDRADVVAFGDGLNDHEMLSWAGWGVAMGNAAPVTKGLADEVTAGNDEDGVALVLERLLVDVPIARGRRDDHDDHAGGRGAADQAGRH